MTKKSISQKARHLGSFGLAMICVSAIVSLRNLPTTALEGSKVIFFFGLSGLLFFLPAALSCAELAAAWPEKGGVYTWIKAAFGPDLAFFAIWLEWIESVVWLPTVLSFLAAMSAYLFNPELEFNKQFMVIGMLAYLWGTTIINFYGLRFSSLLSSLGVVFGSLLPALLLISLGAWYFYQYPTIALSNLNFKECLPSGDLNSLVTFTAILLGFCGMEIPAFYIHEVKNPQKTYPKAMLLASIIILSVCIFGSLTISAIVPVANISLTAGPMQAFDLFFQELNLSFLSPFIAGLTLLGGLALLNTWIIGPSKGLLIIAKEGHIPKLFLPKDNETPVELLILQAVIASVLTLLFVYNPSIKSAYWVLTILATQLYLIMYVMLFLAVIKLRYTHQEQVRPYKIPGGTVGCWLICGGGALASVAAIAVGFVVPANINMAINAKQYFCLLLLAILAFASPPLWLKLFRKK